MSRAGSVPLTDALCTRCGLCCDGTLFADVELASRRESRRMEDLGLRIDEDAGEAPLMLLPCAALRGTRCSVYAHRPECCRTFECALLQRAGRGLVRVEEASATIRETRAQLARVRALLGRLGGADLTLPVLEQCAEVISRAPGQDRRKGRLQSELRLAAGELERLVRERFLGKPAR